MYLLVAGSIYSIGTYVINYIVQGREINVKYIPLINQANSGELCVATLKVNLPML